MVGNPSRAAAGPLSERDFAFRDEARAAFREFVMQPDFPCVGARAAFNSGSYLIEVYDELGSEAATAALTRDLYDFTRSELQRESEFATFVAIFERPSNTDEAQFEQLLWRQLGALHRADAFDWDPSVQSDPADSQFSFSFAGQALYVIGMHPNSSRIARRF